MSRDTILFDINETVLDLASLRPRFAAALGDADVTAAALREAHEEIGLPPGAAQASSIRSPGFAPRR